MLTEQERRTKTDWLVRRHGANTANQPMTQVAPVAIITFATRPEACGVANANLDCYTGQWLELVAFRDADPGEWNAVAQRDAELRAVGEDGVVWSA